ncbi:MDR family MFS transporter [Sporolactobacillus sp. THM19-2]|uniref:MDR family MFS transporter n=1 Tax=Sporolactobacillus sp. THM19-2 TaxID=2511171 RepID=UPI00101F4581|nr:MDR family MFS transporter [Sporolactobacillus sp. THM19-2]RYL92197.1 MFS transporter [Sporolactobacillus sp. THM19-2]
MKQTNRSIVMTGLMIGTFLTAIEGTVISTAIPSIVSDLHGIRIMDWAFSIFMLTSAVTVPLFGKLSDVFGRKRLFTIGTGFFLFGSALCGLSWSMESFITARGIQGIGAGGVMTISTTIIGDIFPIKTRAKMFGMIGMIWGVAGIFGPLVGGFFVDALSWHWIFFINIPFGLTSVFLITTGFKENRRRKKQKIDVAGAASFTISMAALLYGLQRAGESGRWLDAQNLILFTLFITVLALFLYIETRAEDPMIPVSVLWQPIVAITNGLALVASAILMGNDMYMPMWLQGLLGYSATASGFVLTPMSITWMVGSFLCGWLLAHSGVRISGFIGTGLLLAGTFWLELLDPGVNPLLYYLITSLLGLGFGLALTLTTLCVQSAAGHQMRGAATASNQFFRSVGQAIGAAVFGAYFNTSAAERALCHGQDPERVLNGLNAMLHSGGGRDHPSYGQIFQDVLFFSIHHVFVVMTILAIAAVIIAFFLPGQLPDEKDHKV